MQLQSLFESFEYQLDWPSRSVELDDLGSRPVLLREGRGQQQDPTPPGRSHAVFGTMFAPDVLSFARSGTALACLRGKTSITRRTGKRSLWLESQTQTVR